MSYFRVLCAFLCLPFSFVAAQSKNKIEKEVYVKIETNRGTMVFSLSPHTPQHVANFVKLAKQGYFDRYDFNRVIKSFVAQGGETDSAYAAMEKAGRVLQRILPEFNANLFHQKGALAAGRDDNADKASFLGQIYIVDGKRYSDSQLDAIEKRNGNGFKFTAAQRQVYKEIGGTPNLDQNYTVFGQLIKGMEVLNDIMNQPANKSGKPAVSIAIKISVLSKKDVAKLIAAN